LAPDAALSGTKTENLNDRQGKKFPLNEFRGTGKMPENGKIHLRGPKDDEKEAEC